MSSGVVPNYQPCLLVTIGIACWSILHFNQPFDLVECRGEWDGYKSGATLTEVSLHQTCLLIRSHSQTCLLVKCNCMTCMLGSFIQIHMFVKCFSIRQEIWHVTNPPDMSTGKVRLPRVCKAYQLPAWTPS